MTTADEVVPAENLCSFFRSFGNNSAKAGKRLGENVTENPGKALEVKAKVVLQQYREILKLFYLLSEIL